MGVAVGMVVGWCGDVWLRYGRCGVERSAGGCSVECSVECGARCGGVWWLGVGVKGIAFKI